LSSYNEREQTQAHEVGLTRNEEGNPQFSVFTFPFSVCNAPIKDLKDFIDLKDLIKKAQPLNIKRKKITQKQIL